MTVQELITALVTTRKSKLTQGLVDDLNTISQRHLGLVIFNADKTINSNAAVAVLSGLLTGQGEQGLPAAVDTYIQNDVESFLQAKLEEVAEGEGINVQEAQP